MKYLVVLLSIMLSASAFSQGFIKEIDNDNLSLILAKPCVVTLVSGEEVSGTLRGAVIINGYLDRITLKKENGEKLKLKPVDISRLVVKASRLAKLSMIAESTISIKELTKTNFEEIVNREYIIFETAMRSNKAGKLRLMQLLNPGFDSQIKVFANPNANETGGFSVSGVKLTGGAKRSFLFLEHGNKTIIVRKSNYKKNFDELYQNCPKMLAVFSGEKVKWDDVAGHVFTYDQSCK